MNFTHLKTKNILKAVRIFRTVYEEGGIRAASRKLNINAATICTTIDLFESDVGGKLFVSRCGKNGRMQPTEHCRAIYAISESVDSMINFLNNVNNKSITNITTIRIGIHPLSSVEMLPLIMSSYCNSDIKVRIDIINKNDMIEMLTTNVFDLIIYPTDVSFRNRYQDLCNFITLHQYIITAFMSINNKLAKIPEDQINQGALIKGNILPKNAQWRFDHINDQFSNIEKELQFTTSTSSFDLGIFSYIIKYNLGIICTGYELSHFLPSEFTFKKLDYLNLNAMHWSVIYRKNNNYDTKCAMIKKIISAIQKQQNQKDRNQLS